MVLRRLMAGAVALLAVSAGLSVGSAAPASAAALQEITGFGTNPGSLRMYLYVPDGVRSPAPVLVANHYCTGSGPDFFAYRGFDELADQYGFIVVYPSVTASDLCFDVASSATLTHNGGGDSFSIVSMVNWVKSHYAVDSSRVYATGESSGAMMTEVLLGAYPDVFAAGSAFAGVPFGCFAGNDKWNSACALGLIDKTPQEWGDLVRNAYPGYSGPRPRVQLWHGTADGILNYTNYTEAIEQWTNVLGLGLTPSSTDYPATNRTRMRWTNSAGTTVLEANSLAGTPHTLPVDAEAAIHFFGLDGSSTTSTTTTTTTTTTRPTTTTMTTTRPTTTTTTTTTTRPTTTSTTTRPTTTTTTTTRPTTTTTTTTSSSSGGGGRTCVATYAVVGQWPGGFQGEVRVTAGSTAISGWTVTWTFANGQVVQQSWGSTLTSGGATVTASNASWNGSLAAGASTTLGFIASWNGTNATPTPTCTAT